jgi:formiminotetrahydrofolate cyclodeaminase
VSRQLLAIYTETNRFLISDTQMVALMLECTLRTARLNIDINLKSCHASEVIEPLQQRIITQTPTQQALKTLISGFDLE